MAPAIKKDIRKPELFMLFDLKVGKGKKNNKGNDRYGFRF
jgi:hypothetical protein